MIGGQAVLVGLCALGVAFIAGASVGLFLNVTQEHRIVRWANKICDTLDLT